MRVETVGDDIARIKFVRVAFGAQNHRRFQRTSDAGSPMGDKVEIGILPGIAAEIRRGSGPLGLQDFAILVGKVAAHFLNLYRRLGQGGIAGSGNSVSDEEKVLPRYDFSN